MKIDAEENPPKRQIRATLGPIHQKIAPRQETARQDLSLRNVPSNEPLLHWRPVVGWLDKRLVVVVRHPDVSRIQERGHDIFQERNII